MATGRNTIALGWRKRQINVGCAECGVGDGYALYCVECSEKYVKRTWVGLNNEDMKDERTHNFDFIHGARWAEDKLKEKNES